MNVEPASGRLKSDVLSKGVWDSMLVWGKVGMGSCLEILDKRRVHVDCSKFKSLQKEVVAVAYLCLKLASSATEGPE